jgi:hypothetical protein
MQDVDGVIVVRHQVLPAVVEDRNFQHTAVRTNRTIATMIVTKIALANKVPSTVGHYQHVVNTYYCLGSGGGAYMGDTSLDIDTQSDTGYGQCLFDRKLP